MDCKDFHDQLVEPRGKIRKLMDDYVCVMITDMTGVDIGLFDFDPDTTLYCFIMNADEQIYLRYGGRDDTSPDTYLNDDSLEIALEKGLELHEQYQAGELEKVKRPDPKFPRDYPEIKNGPLKKKQCVHCHHMGSGRVKLQQSQGKLDKLKDSFVYPDIAKLGVQLDPEQPLEVDKVDDPAEEAGIERKDVIAKVEGVRVHSWGDLQHEINKKPFDAKELKLTVLRDDEEVEVAIPLGEWWRATDIRRRSSTHALEPFPGFWGKPVENRDKRRYGIDEEDFACEVTKFWVNTNGQKAGLKVGDIVYQVDDVTNAPYTDHPPTWIRLNKEAGDTITIKVLRGGKKLEFSFKLKARPW